MMSHSSFSVVKFPMFVWCRAEKGICVMFTITCFIYTFQPNTPDYSSAVIHTIVMGNQHLITSSKPVHASCIPMSPYALWPFTVESWLIYIVWWKKASNFKPITMWAYFSNMWYNMSAPTKRWSNWLLWVNCVDFYQKASEASNQTFCDKCKQTVSQWWPL